MALVVLFAEHCRRGYTWLAILAVLVALAFRVVFEYLAPTILALAYIKWDV